MPQMGESIAEGTVSKWLKRLGEAVERDEPILEISTDKVDAEIPSPAAGTLAEITVQEGETVGVGTIVAYIDSDGNAPAAQRPAPHGARASPPPPAPRAQAPAEVEKAAGEEPEETEEAEIAASVPSLPRERSPEAAGQTAEERARTRSTPVVRKIAEEHGIDVESVPGTGHAGRVTKQDILSFIEGGGSPGGATAPTPAPSPAPAPAQPEAPASRAPLAEPG